MKKLLALLFITASTSANADFIPASWSDSLEFDIDFSVLYDNFTYAHNLTADGFEPGMDVIIDFDLAIDLADDLDRWREAVRIDLPGVLGDRTFFDLYGDEYGGWSLLGLIELNRVGTLTVTVDRLYGDFSLRGSQLTGKGFSSAVVSVPEPGTLALLGLGLIAVGLARRRKLA